MSNTHTHPYNQFKCFAHTHSDELSGIFSPFSIFIFFVLAYTNTFSKIHRYTHMYRFKIFLLLRNNFHFGGIFRRKKLSFLLFENSLETTQLFHFFYTHTLSHAPLAYKFTYIKKRSPSSSVNFIWLFFTVEFCIY